MNIKVTGCNNCPFRPMEYDLGDCNLFIHLFPNEYDSHIRIYEKSLEYRTDIPKECPIKATESKSITITIKQ